MVSVTLDSLGLRAEVSFCLPLELFLCPHLDYGQTPEEKLDGGDVMPREKTVQTPERIQGHPCENSRTLRSVSKM